jgi:hypothetical protein
MSEDKFKPTKEEQFEYHNLGQVLQVIRVINKQNSSIPGFIIKLYALWLHETLSNITSSPTILPKEDIDALRKAYKDQFDALTLEVNHMFANTEVIERVKAAREKK